MLKFLNRLLGRKEREKTPMRDVRAMSAGLDVPALQAVLADQPSRSHFGGAPGLPRDVVWPERNGRRLAFLARISLAEVQSALPIDWLPESGALLFFYDLKEMPWGFDPKDRGGWAVLHVSDAQDFDVTPTTDDQVPFRHIAFRQIASLPSTERACVEALRFTDEEADAYIELGEDALSGETGHQVSGFPGPVQGDCMELECQLASNGLYCGDSTGYDDPRAGAMTPGAADWKLLFQIDSDDDLGLMWGDCGRIYFWVRQEEARRGEFGNAWLVLQCA
jgi:uncharacterized protein YwqG